MRRVFCKTTCQCTSPVENLRDGQSQEYTLRIRSKTFKLILPHLLDMSQIPVEVEDILSSFENLYRESMALKHQLHLKAQKKKTGSNLSKRRSFLDPEMKNLQSQASFGEKVDRVLFFYLHGSSKCRDLSQKSGCSVGFIKKVIHHFDLTGEVLTSDRLKSRLQAINTIKRFLESQADMFSSLGEYKRKILSEFQISVSKGFLSKCLKSMGRFYGGLPKRLNPPKRSIPSQHRDLVVQLLRTVLRTSASEDSELFFLDEFKCPVRQVPSEFWRSKSITAADISDRTSRSECITCVCLASFEGFIFCQYFVQELTAASFEYALACIFRYLSTRPKMFRIILDQAKWHTSALITDGPFSPYLVFNCPKIWELNLIEGLFSPVRNLFRRRPFVNNLFRELESITDIFSQCSRRTVVQNSKRNYYRTAIRVIKKFLLEDRMIGDQ